MKLSSVWFWSLHSVSAEARRWKDDGFDHCFGSSLLLYSHSPFQTQARRTSLERRKQDCFRKIRWFSLNRISWPHIESFLLSWQMLSSLWKQGGCKDSLMRATRPQYQVPFILAMNLSVQGWPWVLLYTGSTYCGFQDVGSLLNVCEYHQCHPHSNLMRMCYPDPCYTCGETEAQRSNVKMVLLIHSFLWC